MAGPDCMALRMLYLNFLGLLGLLLLLSRSLDAKDIELLALRQEKAVQRRRLGARPRLAWPEHAVLAALARHLPTRLRRYRLATPGTLLSWHRRLVCWSWRQNPARTGPPPVSEEITALTCACRGRTRPGGSTRIQGVLRRLGHRVGRTASKPFRSRRPGPMRPTGRPYDRRPDPRDH
ncbi:helix-turn-helix domain-containing protein [Streptomyces sp. ME01-24h]|nr:helix-turn-helix domain-containing protein [Streptomyces sp. ME01-24h]